LLGAQFPVHGTQFSVHLNKAESRLLLIFLSLIQPIDIEEINQGNSTSGKIIGDYKWKK